MMSPPAILCGCLLTFAAAAEFAGGAGPSFRADGPDAERYGSREGFPACRGTEYVGDLRCRVGAFSRFDTLFLARAIAPSPHQLVVVGLVARGAGEFRDAGATGELDPDLGDQDPFEVEADDAHEGPRGSTSRRTGAAGHGRRRCGTIGAGGGSRGAPPAGAA